MKRRDFLKRLGIGAGALALTELGRQTLTKTPPSGNEIIEEFDYKPSGPEIDLSSVDFDAWSDFNSPDLIVGSQKMFEDYHKIYPQTYELDHGQITLTNENTIWDGSTFTIPTREEMTGGIQTAVEQTSRFVHDQEIAKELQEKMNDAANAMLDRVHQDIYFSNGYASDQGIFNDPSFSDQYREWRLVWDDKTS